MGRFKISHVEVFSGFKYKELILNCLSLAQSLFWDDADANFKNAHAGHAHKASKTGPPPQQTPQYESRTISAMFTALASTEGYLVATKGVLLYGVGAKVPEGCFKIGCFNCRIVVLTLHVIEESQVCKSDG